MIVAGIWFIQNNGSTIASNNKYPLIITPLNLEQLKDNNIAIIIDFRADECVPCKMMAPVFRTIK